MGRVNMDWQTATAIGIALLCGAWALWCWLRLFFRRDEFGCGACDSCHTAKGSGELLEITPLGKFSLN